MMPADSLPDWMRAARDRAPLYRIVADRSPAYWHDADDLSATAASLGDPFGGRHDPSRPPMVFPQVARDLPLFWALDAGDVDRMARELASSWIELGIVPDERVALYDYSSSPIVAYASRA
ncbi:MAG TPA: hypothetical protein VLA54_06715, partial [Acidimicrobiia bacterium]|nr:hypothetical protein [Acidimicrobiia bacterium]